MKKYSFGFLLIFLMIGLTVGCQKTRKQTVDKEDDSVMLYYLNTEENGLTKVKKKLDLTGDQEEDICMVLDQLKKADKSEDHKYKSVLDKQITYQSVDIDDEGNTTIDFGSGYSTMSQWSEVLCRAAVVKSLVQLEGINTVTFTIDGDPLTNAEGVPVGIMRADTFVLDSDKEEIYDDTESVNLYLSNKEGDSLVEVPYDIHLKDNQSMEDAVLKALKTYTVKETKTPLPEDLEFNRITVIKDICYVDLNEEIYTALNNVEEEIKVYSMVNTLTSLQRITQVQFTVNGETVSDMNDISGFDSPMSCDYSFVEQ